MKLKFSFTQWLASPSAVSLTLAIGVFFLVSNYEVILHLTNPQNAQDIDMAKYPFALRWIFSHLDSLFFGLATAIIMFQSKSDRLKILYCVLEAIMIFLNLNQAYVSAYFGTNSQFLLGTYIAVFSGFTLYFLGTLAKQHNENKVQATHQGEASPTPQMPIVNVFGEPYNAPQVQPQVIGFQLNANVPKQGKQGRPPLSPEKVAEIQAHLDNGYSMRKTAEACNVSLQKVTEVKNASKAV
jgi:hypothetical protein